MSARALVATSFVTFMIACGGGGSPPPHATTGAADAAPPETFGTPNPEDLAELAAGQKAADAGTSPTPATTTAQASPATPPPPPDECTPVGVDFEKRARPKLK